MKFARHFRSLMTILLCVPIVSGASAELLDDIAAAGKLRVGMSSFQPWAMRDKNGGFVGFEPDVARALAEDLGVELEIVPTKWDGILPALLAGKFDLIVSGMSVTPARNLKINFTVPYARSGLELAANLEKAAGFQTLADFNREGVVVAMRRGVAGLEAVRRLLPKATIRQFDDEAACRQEVVNGAAHAWISAAPAPAHAAAEHPDKLFLPLPAVFENSIESFGVRKGEHEALNFLDNWIMLRTENGWLQARHDYWFKAREWAARVQ